MTHPALGAVASALSRVDVSSLPPWGASELRVEEWRVGERRGTPRDAPPATFWHRWSTCDRGEALEALAARGLVPEHWTDPAAAPTWWWCRCAACASSRQADRSRCAYPLGSARVEPASMVDLVSVAALGAPALRLVEEVAREAFHSRPLWRVLVAPRLPRSGAAPGPFERALADLGVASRAVGAPPGFVIVEAPRA